MNCIFFIMAIHSLMFQHKTVVTHPLKYSGLQWTTKVLNLRETLKSKGYKAMVVSEMDEIAWLFNLRKHS